MPAIYEASLAHQTLFVSIEEAYEWIRRVTAKEDLLLRMGSAVVLAGAVKVSEQINEGMTVTVFTDNTYLAIRVSQ